MIVKEYNVSISRAYKLMDIHRSYFYYTEKKDDSEVKQAIREAAEFGDGFWKIFQRLRHDGKPWNHKKVYRVTDALREAQQADYLKRLSGLTESQRTYDATMDRSSSPRCSRNGAKATI